jgi:hypothetical protein
MGKGSEAGRVEDLPSTCPSSAEAEAASCVEQQLDIHPGCTVSRPLPGQYSEGRGRGRGPQPLQPLQLQGGSEAGGEVPGRGKSRAW